jgi:hypothetical protein
MAEEYRVNVYESEESDEVVSRVRYNSDLDYWDGRNWTNGGTGRHKGITKLKDGRYVIIHGTQWQDEKDKAYIVSPEEAIQEILRAQKVELFKTKKYKDLGKLAEEKGMIGETEYDEDEEV